MITSMSPKDEILSVCIEESEKAQYWFRKQTNGRKWDEISENLILQHKKTGTPHYSDMIEYTSRRGNKWCSFIRSRKIGSCYGTFLQSFMYRETLGSIEIFNVISKGCVGGDSYGVMIFTSHFFLRMAQKLGVAADRKEIAQRFLSLSDGMVFHEKGDGKKRKAELEISFMGTIWRGVYKNGDKRVVEIKTMLKRTELTAKEKNSLKDVEAAQNNVVYHNRMSDLERIKDKDVSFVAELYNNSFIYHASDLVSSVFEDCMALTKMTSDRLCVDYTFDDFMSFYITDIKADGVVLNDIVKLAYDSISEAVRANHLKAIVVVTLHCLYCKIPQERIIDCFYTSYEEYMGNPNEHLDRHKDFFVLKDKSMFENQDSLKIPTSPEWARGLVSNLIKR